MRVIKELVMVLYPITVVFTDRYINAFSRYCPKVSLTIKLPKEY